jgi:hypothetical protein
MVGRRRAEEAIQEAAVSFLHFYEGEPGEHALRWMLVVLKPAAWA